MPIPQMPNDIEVGKVFRITKMSRTKRYKIISHPFFDGGYALIGDHALLGYSFYPEDEKHIIHGSQTIEKAWQAAYDHT